MIVLLLWYDLSKYDPYSNCPCNGEDGEYDEEYDDDDECPCKVSVSL